MSETQEKSKSTRRSTEVPVRLHLMPSRAFRSRRGRAVKTVGPLPARFDLTPDGIDVDLGLPDLTRAELRWSADQLMRRIRGMFDVGDIIIDRHADVATETLATIALDLHHATHGRASVQGDEVAARVLTTYGPPEDGFRTWVNEDPAIRTSIAIADDARRFAAEREHVDVEILEEAELQQHGLRLLLAVGGASVDSPPRLVIARYTPPGTESESPLMLLGKGITFDTGGINVKPYESYVSHMKNDMAGSALAWWVFRTLVEQGHEQPLLVVLPTCENAVGERAMRPGSIVKSYRGKRVRIDHTDAEGRLALADGLAYATDKYKPHQVYSFATLTTAALISYGPYATPVHFADDATRQRLEEASDVMGEDLHFFPYRLWHFEANRDQEADLRNTARLPGNASRGAGSRNAAHFLRHFTEVPLVHLDIFASTWNWAGDAPGAGYGATGAPLRTLLRSFLGA